MNVRSRTKVDLTKYLEEHLFVFDQVFDEDVSNEQLYAEAVQPLVDAAFAGIKVTCFAYGQTGSGKTFTMMGNQKEDQFVPGMFLLAANEMFNKIEQHKWNLSVWVSFYEIYCGKLFDLLNDRKILFAREDGKQVDLIVDVECLDSRVIREDVKFSRRVNVSDILWNGS
jgi:kinesin family protein 2/24